MKKIIMTLVIFFGLSLSAAAQHVVNVPYYANTDGYWSGVAVSSDFEQCVDMIVTDEWNVPVDNFMWTFNVPGVQRALVFSDGYGQLVLIGEFPFNVTLFIGSDQGFAFQSFKSEGAYAE